MRKFISGLLAIAAAAFTGCYESGTDADNTSREARISISPAAIGFDADGRTTDGLAFGTYIVTVNPYGKMYSDWHAELVGTDWATLDYHTASPDGAVEKALRITCSANTDYKRTGTLRVTLSKTGESVDFPITQVGLKPDATLTLSTESDIEMMALEPAEVTVTFETNMPASTVTAELEEGVEWLTCTLDREAGTVVLAASDNTSPTDMREATVTVSAGTEDTSLATRQIKVRQLANETYLFIYGSGIVGRFETFTVTLDGLSPTSRIAFSSNPAQAGANKTRYLLDDIVVVYDGETKLEKLTVPANVKFDAEAVYSDKLTLEWDEVPGAASYTVAWWADGTEEKDATVAEGITSASYLLKELEAGTEYHAKVKACRYNNPGYDSDYSAVVSQKTDIAPVQAGIVVSKVLATSSTLTVEWARADGQACVNSSAQVYHVKLYSDAECKDLVVGWNASNVFGITAGNRFRFTFSGLAPATTYYVCVDDKTNDFFSDPLAYATAAAGPQAGATTAGSAKAGDILLAEDFSRVIHGGDIANFAAGYYPPSSNRGTYAAASGDNPSGFSATRCTANEFDVFSGGGVAAPYTEGTGLAAWGKSGNIAGRPGYVKMGAGSAAASLYTPELTALPDAATVKVRFSAQAYSEKYDGSGADAGKILVKAVRGAVLGAKGAITGTVTEVSAADPVDISAAKARFREFEATLTNVTPDCRIVISTSEKRALLDNVVVTCTAITPATKPAAPGGVSFDAAAAADRLTLKWNAVPDATSYTVAYWKGSASAPESEYAYKTGIASTATSQELTNLESNTSYWAKVKAVGSLDSDWSETANATTMDSGGEPLLPTADLLDVVFRNDGSAMDNSSSATPVRRMPSSRP